MHNPRVAHMVAIHRILRYIKGTLDYGLQLYKSPISSLLSYTNANWGGCPDTRRSTSGYCVFLGDNLISWSAKRQPIVSISSVEAEYRGVANVVSETCWAHNLLLELRCPINTAILFIVAMSVLFIYQTTRFIINVLNLLRWTSILFVNKSNVVMFGCFMSHLDIRLPTFSPKAFLKLSSMIFAPVSTSANLSIRLRGCDRI